GGISLRDVDQIEERSAGAEQWIGLMRIGRFLQRHGAGGHFVKPIVDRIRFGHVGEWYVNRDVAARAESRLTIRWWQRGVARISQNAAAADQLDVVFADETIERAPVSRFGVNVEISSAGAVRR